MTTCKGCGEPVVSGQLRYMEDWHASCHATARAKLGFSRADDRPEGFRLSIGYTRETFKAGDRFALRQPSFPQHRHNKGIHSRPRRYGVPFDVSETGEAVFLGRGHIKPRQFYQIMANVMARNGDLAEFVEGFNDALERNAPEPGGNRGRDYSDGFELGRDESVVADELYRTRGKKPPRRK